MMIGRRCCFCFSSRVGLFLTAGISLAGCTGVLLPSVYCMVKEDGWKRLREWVNSWLVRNHWDVEVTQSVWKGLDWMDEHHQLFLVALITAASFHLTTTLLLILGTMLKRRGLLIPWIITDSIIIVIMVIIFVGWTFFSFFVDLLIAIVFPVVACLLLGLWVVLWRNTLYMYSVHMNPPTSQNETKPNNKLGYTTVPVKSISKDSYLLTIQE